MELNLAKLAFPRKNDDRLISLSVGIKTASKEDIAQHELRKYKGSRMASFRVHNHLASMKNSTMAYRTWKGSRAAPTKKELLAGSTSGRSTFNGGSSEWRSSCQRPHWMAWPRSRHTQPT